MFQFHSRRLWKMSPCQPSKPYSKPPANSADVSSAPSVAGRRADFGELRIRTCLQASGVRAFLGSVSGHAFRHAGVKAFPSFVTRHASRDAGSEGIFEL